MYFVPLLVFASILWKCSSQLILGTIAVIEFTIEFMEMEAVVATAEISVEGPVVGVTESAVESEVLLQTQELEVGGSYTVRAGIPGRLGRRDVSGSFGLDNVRITDTTISGSVDITLRPLRVNFDITTPRVQVSVPYQAGITFGPRHGPGPSHGVSFSMHDAVVHGRGRFGIGRNSHLIWRIRSSTGRFLGSR